MNVFNNYFKIFKNISSLEELTIHTFQFLKSNGAIISLLSHTPEINSLKLIESDDHKELEFWFSKLKALDIDTQCDIYLDDAYYYYFSSLNLEQQKVIIFACEPNDLCKIILPAWQSFYTIFHNQHQTNLLELENNYGNIISQLLHDVHSLIELAEDRKEQYLIDKIAYQRKVNKNLLFYIREQDLFKTPISLYELIKDSLELFNIEYADLNVKIDNPYLQINLDVDLFSKGFNEIVENALRATENDYSKIFIKVYTKKSNSPFLKHKWVIIEVNDKGRGIPEDYLPLVKRPFFTTGKEKGLSGFGLSNAEKIMTAHHGKIEVNSEDGTNIKIILPQLSNEK